jgi:hypothetical protein
MSMRKKYSGSVVRANPVVPTEDSASGIWTLDQQNQNQKRGTWPFIGDPNFKDTVLLLHGDTSQTPSSEDQSSSNHEVTIAGDSKATNWSPFNLPEGYWSILFDHNNDDKVVVGDTQTGCGFGSSADFQIDCMIYSTRPSSDSQGFFGTQGTNTDSTGWRLQYDGSNIDWNHGTSNIHTFAFTFTPNTWFHFVIQRVSGTFKIFIDGVEKISVSDTTNYGATTNLTLGNGGNTGAGEMSGYLSNLRVITGASSTTSKITSPLSSNSDTLCLVAQSNRFVDNSLNNKTLTATNTPKVLPFSPLSYTPTATENNYGSYYFDGTGDYLSIASNEDFKFGTEDFTIEMWVYAVKTTEQAIYDGRSANGAYPYILIQNSSNKFIYYVSTGVRITANDTVPLYQWVHLAIARSGTTTKMFVNGTQQTGTYTDSTDYGQAPVYIGQNQPAGGENFEGYISNLRVIKGNALYTSSFTVPTKPVELTLTEGENSVYFDGTGDYLNVTYSSSLNFGTGDFTIEFWAYQETATNYTTWYSHGYISQSGNILLQSGNNSSNIRVYLNTNSPQITSSSSLTLNAWTHVALVRSSGQVTLYFNGVSVGTSSTSSINLNETSDATIGMGDSSHYLDGYISNMRLTAKALYTGTFTPPDAPFSGTTGVLLACASRYIEDRSPQKLNVAANGDAVVSGFNPFNDGYWSNLFDGTNDFITMPNVSDLNLGTGNFTIDVFIYPTDSGSNRMIIGGTGSQDYINLQNANTIQVVFSTTGDSKTFALGTTITNKWSHLAVVRKNSTTCEVFLDGVSKGTNTIGSTATFNSQSGFIAKWGYNTSYRFQGNISNLRIIKGSNIYSGGNFTPSSTPITTTTGGATASEVKLLTCQSNRFIDNSSSANSITVSGNPSIDESIPFELPSRQTKLLNLQNNQDVNNNSFQDSSLLKNFITRTGNVAQGTFSPFGAEEGYWSVFIDGTDDILSVPNSSNHEFGTGQFTVEFWVYMSNKDGTNGQGFLGNYGSASNGWAVQLYGNNLEFAVKNGQIAQYNWSSRENNRWYHLAFARDGSNNMRAFIDGTQVVTGVKTDDITIGSNALQIGNMGPSITRRFKGGYISNVRIVKGTALYTSTFTRPTAPLTTTSQGATASEVELLMCQSSSFVDNSSNAFTITLTSTPKVQPYAPFAPRRSYSKEVVGGSAYFDGTGDYLTTDTGDIFDFTGEFTVECWFYLSDAVNWGVLFCANVSDRFQIAITNSDTLDLRFNGGILGTPFSINKNEWNHIAVTRDSSNVVRQFLNGVLKNTNTNTSSLDNGYMRIGANQNGANPFEGYIANARIVNGQAIYTTAFDTPTSLVTRTSDTRLLLNFTDGAVIDNTGKNNFETRENTKVVPYIKKFGNGSMYFDGSTDYLKTSNSNPNIYDFGTENVTIEMFVNFSTLSGVRPLISVRTGGSGGWGLYWNSNEIYWVGGASINTSSSGISSTGVWHHIVFVREGSTISLYIDGTKNGTNTSMTAAIDNPGNESPSLGQGWPSGMTDFHGYIDECRITKGVARYTGSSLTVPTRAFKNR